MLKTGTGQQGIWHHNMDFTRILQLLLTWIGQPSICWETSSHDPDQKVNLSMCVVGVLRDWAWCFGVWPKSKTTDLDWQKKTATSPETSERIFSKQNVQEVCLDSDHTTPWLLSKSMATASTSQRQCRLGCNFKVYHGTVNTQVQCSTV